MKKALFLLATLSLSLIAAAQSPQQPSASPSATEEPVLFTAAENPEFPGGKEGLYQFLVTNIQWPEIQGKAIEKEGKVWVSFVVEKNGSVSNVKVIESLDPAFDAEALRVVSAMPKWKPAKVDGKPERILLSLPIVFTKNAPTEHKAN